MLVYNKNRLKLEMKEKNLGEKMIDYNLNCKDWLYN